MRNHKRLYKLSDESESLYRRNEVVEGQRGVLRVCEFDHFTLSFQQGLRRLTNHTELSEQREDILRDKDCAAA